MGEGGQCPSHPRPKHPPPQTCLDFYQGKNVAVRGKVLKLKRSGLGPTGERTEAGSGEEALPIWGPALVGTHQVH